MMKLRQKWQSLYIPLEVNIGANDVCEMLEHIGHQLVNLSSIIFAFLQVRKYNFAKQFHGFKNPDF